MKTTLFPTSALALIFLCGCTSAPDYTKLTAGMPREDVIKIMGQPESATKKGDVEILTFRTADVRTAAPDQLTEFEIDHVSLRGGTVYSVEHLPEPYIHPTASNARLLPGNGVTADIRLVSHSPTAADNRIEIVSIEPAIAAPDKPTKFVVKVGYSMALYNEARISLAFNTRGPKAFDSVGAQTVYAGSGVVEYTVTLTPKSWPSGEQFTTSVWLWVNGKLVPETRVRKDIELSK